MKKGLYRTLAWTGIRKNRKLYVPYLLTCAGMVMMCYIVSFLSSCPPSRCCAAGGTCRAS